MTPMRKTFVFQILVWLVASAHAALDQTVLYRAPSLQLVETVVKEAERNGAQMLDVRLSAGTEIHVVSSDSPKLVLHGTMEVGSLLSPDFKRISEHAFSGLFAPVPDFYSKFDIPRWWIPLDSAGRSKDLDTEFLVAVARNKSMKVQELTFVARVAREHRENIRQVILWGREDEKTRVESLKENANNPWLVLANLAHLRRGGDDEISDYLNPLVLKADTSGTADLLLQKFYMLFEEDNAFNAGVVQFVFESGEPKLATGLLHAFAEHARFGGRKRKLLIRSKLVSHLERKLAEGDVAGGEEIEHAARELRRVLSEPVREKLNKRLLADYERMLESARRMKGVLEQRKDSAGVSRVERQIDTLEKTIESMKATGNTAKQERTLAEFEKKLKSAKRTKVLQEKMNDSEGVAATIREIEALEETIEAIKALDDYDSLNTAEEMRACLELWDRMELRKVVQNDEESVDRVERAIRVLTEKLDALQSAGTEK